METKLWRSSSGAVEIEMTLEQASRVSHQGQCYQDVVDLMSKLGNQLNKINPEVLKQDLKEYGAWDNTQLSNHQDNLERVVWIAGGDLMDQSYNEEAGQ